MYAILGLLMIYTWVHSVVVIFKKLKKPTQYEKVVLWFALVTGVLFVVGTLS